FPHRLVCRIACDSDPRAVRHTHGGQPATEQAEPSTDDYNPANRVAGYRSPLFPASRATRLHSDATYVFSLSDRSSKHLPGACRSNQAQADEAPYGLINLVEQLDEV